LELQAIRLVVDGLAFPEGPVPSSTGLCWAWTFAPGRLSRITPTGTEVVAEPGGGPNGAATGPDGALYVCDNGGLRSSDGRGRIEHVGLVTGAGARIIERKWTVCRCTPRTTRCSTGSARFGH
jgi:gluconolactonase